MLSSENQPTTDPEPDGRREPGTSTRELLLRERAKFKEEERKQLESDMKSWRTRLEQFERDLKTEPGRIREFYEVRVTRVEPVGLVYLWPESN